MKDIDTRYIEKMDIAPFEREFQENGILSDETLEKIMGRKPILSSDYSDLDSRLMAMDDLHRWKACLEVLYKRLDQAS